MTIVITWATGAGTIAGMRFSDLHTGPAETLVAELRDYPEWHRGRERYGVWMVPIDDAALLSYIGDARRQLADLLHPCPHRQPHLTVFVCGFHEQQRVADDDFSPEQLRRQLALMENGTGAPCSLPLAPPDSFASAAFIPVGDPQGRLAHWRRLLGKASEEVRPSAYIPHITLGLYRRRVDAQVIRERLGGIAAPAMPMAITQLHYATYDTRSQFGPLHSHHRLSLSARAVLS